ncbi:MAG: flavin reductase family protein [Rhizobiales bacterium]|nr:flavin reductase family protein [Hyphomicrobiales bacterium]
MFYKTASNDHGLPHNPLKAIVTPRPIGWISTQNSEGQYNLAPYSFFNLVSDTPPIVMFSSGGWKDSVSNARDTGVFACNFSSHKLRDAMNATSAPLAEGVSEFEHAGLTAERCQMIDAPRVSGASACLECETIEVKQLVGKDGQNSDYIMVLGQVVGVYIRDDYLNKGMFDTAAARPLARLGYRDFSVVDEVFQLTRPET